MTLASRLSLAFLLTACGTAVAAPINLVNNGSFEQGTLGEGSFKGWTTTLGDMSTFVDSSRQTGSNYGQASDGLWAAYFGSTAADGGASIAQTLLTTAGQSYNLTFDLANDNGGAAAANGFTAYLAGLPVFAALNLSSQGFAQEQISFVAASSSTALRFSGYNDQSYVELDNVKVQTAPTPEPSSLALLGTGVAACAGVVRRRRRVSGR